MVAFVVLALAQNPPVALDVRASEHLRFGAAGYGRPNSTLILREGYAALHDSEKKAPLWVSYRLNPAYSANNVPRASSNRWKADPLLMFGFRAELDAYRQSGWDRGHMAPADDMRRSQDVQLDSFILSNSVPQNPSNNSGAWNQLESRARSYGASSDIIIISGPIYGRPMSDGTLQVELTKPGGIPVPSWLFKIIVRARQGQDPEVLAFLIENKPLPGFSPAAHLVSVREVETHTGLNFLNALPVTVQNRIEPSSATSMWPTQ